MNKRIINLRSGAQLEVDLTEAFYDQVRKRYEIDKFEVPSDRQVKAFIHETFSIAIEGASA